MKEFNLESFRSETSEAIRPEKKVSKKEYPSFLEETMNVNLG